MKRPNVTLAIALVLCVITAVISFGGDYINQLFRSGGPSLGRRSPTPISN